MLDYVDVTVSKNRHTCLVFYAHQMMLPSAATPREKESTAPLSSELVPTDNDDVIQ